MAAVKLMLGRDWYHHVCMYVCMIAWEDLVECLATTMACMCLLCRVSNTAHMQLYVNDGVCSRAPTESCSPNQSLCIHSLHKAEARCCLQLEGAIGSWKVLMATCHACCGTCAQVQSSLKHVHDD